MTRPKNFDAPQKFLGFFLGRPKNFWGFFGVPQKFLGFFLGRPKNFWGASKFLGRVMGGLENFCRKITTCQKPMTGVILRDVKNTKFVRISYEFRFFVRNSYEIRFFGNTCYEFRIFSYEFRIFLVPRATRFVFSYEFRIFRWHVVRISYFSYEIRFFVRISYF